MPRAMLAALLLGLTLTPSAGLARQKAGKSATPVRDDIRIVCKRQEVTGSLARTEKVCMSALEWRQLRDNARAMEGDHLCSGNAHCNGS